MGELVSDERCGEISANETIQVIILTVQTLQGISEVIEVIRELAL